MGILSGITGDATTLALNSANLVTDAKSIIGGLLHTPMGASAHFDGAKDLRAKLRVPDEYISKNDPTGALNELGGILFPFTPTISVDNKAEYSSQNPTHSNFTQHFYKYSSVGPIKVSGKFTVQTESEGRILLATIHLLRSLTKMRFGDDSAAGSPPPICRFDAYGDYMFNNVPVAVSNWSHDLPDNVDYITVGRQGTSNLYGYSEVPVLSTISIDLNIMYSRREMMNHNIPDWLGGKLKGQGYL